MSSELCSGLGVSMSPNNVFVNDCWDSVESDTAVTVEPDGECDSEPTAAASDSDDVGVDGDAEVLESKGL